MDRTSGQAVTQDESVNVRRKEFEIYHDGVLGRCPECGRLIMLPCLACQVTASKENALETMAVSTLEIELHGEDMERYRRIRAYRDRHGVPMFE